MQIAIAVYEGETSFSGHRKVRILSCTDPVYEGQKFCINDWIEFGRYILVQFEPDDQFCKRITLNEVREQNICS